MKATIFLSILLLTSLATRADDPVTISGQAFVQTIDNGPIKLADMKVYAFPISALSLFPGPTDFVDPAKVVELPKPLAATATDVDGHFTLKVEMEQPFFIYANGGYYTRRGRYIGFEWRIPLAAIQDRSNLQLKNDNSNTPQQKVEIASD